MHYFVMSYFFLSIRNIEHSFVLFNGKSNILLTENDHLIRMGLPIMQWGLYKFFTQLTSKNFDILAISNTE